jgi:glycosyltransferase involved in cell wall biosynthesis
MKFGLVSHVLPPSDSGQAMVLYQLLKDFDPAAYCLISQDPCDGSSPYGSFSSRLPAKHYHLPLERQNVLAAAVSRGFNIARILRAERCDAVVVCTGDLLNLPATFVASRIAKVPYYIFMCDHYAHQWLNLGDRFLAKVAAPLLVRSAAKTIVSNEHMADAIKEGYGVDPVIIRNPCEPSDYPGVIDDAGLRKDADERSIVFTGAIYAVNVDAFENLVMALAQLKERRVRLHLYSAQRLPESVVRLAPELIVHHPHAALAQMPAIQGRADVLFLPLAFNSPYPQIVKTASTAKLAEYLASGRPILAHAPADSFVSWYVRKERCGVVVDEPAPSKLAEAIVGLLADDALSTSLARRARTLAAHEFPVSKAHAQLATLLGVC